MKIDRASVVRSDQARNRPALQDLSKQESAMQRMFILAIILLGLAAAHAQRRESGIFGWRSFAISA